MTDAYTLLTLRKALDLLEVFGDANLELTMTEIAQRLDESPTVVFRLLKTLEERAFVQQDRRSKRYSLGLRVWELGCRVMRRGGLTEQARPALRWLTEVTGETSYVAVLSGTDIMYMDVVEGLDPLRVYTEPVRVPLYLTASGKAMLAFRNGDLFKQVVAAGMKAQTPLTVTGARRLQERLAVIRRTGLSINRGERRPDISAVAAPIFDRTGECVAAAGASGPSHRFTEERLDRIGEAVRKAAEDISARLGYLMGARAVAAPPAHNDAAPRRSKARVARKTGP